MTAVTAELEKALAERDRLAGLLDLRDGELAHANEQRDMARTELDGARDRLRLLADAHRHWSTRAQRAEAEVESLRATVRGLTSQTQAYVDRAEAEGARIVELADQVERLANQRAAVVAMLRHGYHEASRWENPLPVPDWVQALRIELGETGPGCPCGPCSTSDDRRVRDRREAGQA